ncbi:fungal-specific transcription factor domain-containing protein [Mycena metata]|uniref:Fungal-specific transcription factor domain-containing protein n=1 Tax=Mycena metata TaxID=1033252 RepID=A0AAD7GX06_9AGAR|nr:fungal-specific transcription factor domain-containing protein [Mycena metata]
MKQRRPERSCDICRRKIKCDGPTMPNRNCSNCVAFGSPCTYVEPSRKRGPKNPTVEELKHEIAALKSKLRTLSVCSLCAQPLHSQGASTNASVFQQRSPESDITTVEELPPEDNDVAEELAVRFRQFSVTTMEKKYFGSAGSFALVNNAMAMKEQYTGRPMIVHTRRSLYWDILPWEKEHYDKRAHYTYPDGDLIASLLELYFTVVHPTLPILHRPLFEKSVAEGLHLTNMEFGGLLLSVLALASRYSDDPRVLIEGNSLSAGWKFAKQLEMVRKMFEPSIHETQMYCLMALYSLGTSLPQISWVYLGLGIRFLQQRGKHRRKRDSTNLSVEDELWKKTFWSFMCVDTMMCTFLGRPMGLHGEDYDVNPPLQIDDEYWDCGFTQPPGEPPLISYFICDSRLCEILGDTLRRLYGSRKAKLLMGWNGPQWEQRTVSELNSAMNDFLDTIPSHLRWDPESPPQGVFFDQSASLYITYQYILITIHRPYFHKVPDASMPSSLSICTRAARAIVHTADIWLNKLQRLPPPNMLNPVFVSGVVLSLNIFATKRAGLHPKKDLAQVERAMEILKFAQHRWQAAGRLGELLGGLLSLDGLFPLKNLPSDTDELQPAKPRQSTFTMSGVSPSSTSVHDKPDGQPIPEHLWSGPLSSDHFGPAPGVSIEQLLADTEPLDSMNIVLDDELLSMWMAAPIDISCVIIDSYQAD